MDFLSTQVSESLIYPFVVHELVKDMREKVFTARVQESRRIVIPQVICQILGIERGDTVEVTIRKEEFP